MNHITVLLLLACLWPVLGHEQDLSERIKDLERQLAEAKASLASLPEDDGVALFGDAVVAAAWPETGRQPFPWGILLK